METHAEKLERLRSVVEEVAASEATIRAASTKCGQELAAINEHLRAASEELKAPLLELTQLHAESVAHAQEVTAEREELRLELTQLKEKSAEHARKLADEKDELRLELTQQFTAEKEELELKSIQQLKAESDERARELTAEKEALRLELTQQFRAEKEELELKSIQQLKAESDERARELTAEKEALRLELTQQFTAEKEELEMKSFQQLTVYVECIKKLSADREALGLELSQIRATTAATEAKLAVSDDMRNFLESKNVELHKELNKLQSVTATTAIPSRPDDKRARDDELCDGEEEQTQAKSPRVQTSQTQTPVQTPTDIVSVATSSPTVDLPTALTAPTAPTAPPPTAALTVPPLDQPMVDSSESPTAIVSATAAAATAAAATAAAPTHGPIVPPPSTEPSTAIVPVTAAALTAAAALTRGLTETPPSEPSSTEQLWTEPPPSEWSSTEPPPTEPAPTEVAATLREHLCMQLLTSDCKQARIQLRMGDNYKIRLNAGDELDLGGLLRQLDLSDASFVVRVEHVASGKACTQGDFGMREPNRNMFPDTDGSPEHFIYVANRKEMDFRFARLMLSKKLQYRGGPGDQGELRMVARLNVSEKSWRKLVRDNSEVPVVRSEPFLLISQQRHSTKSTASDKRGSVNQISVRDNIIEDLIENYRVVEDPPLGLLAPQSL